jgi:hypothetical protein
MNMWTAITLIVIAGCAFEALRTRWDAKGKQESGKEVQKLEARIEQLDNELRERIEVLERIVTDRRETLRREFDYLDKAS